MKPSLDQRPPNPSPQPTAPYNLISVFEGWGPLSLDWVGLSHLSGVPPHKLGLHCPSLSAKARNGHWTPGLRRLLSCEDPFQGYRVEQRQGSEAERSEPPAREMPVLPLSPGGIHRHPSPGRHPEGRGTVRGCCATDREPHFPTRTLTHPVLLSCFSPKIKSF